MTYPDIPEFDLNQKLAKEKEVMGVYVSGHPFEKFMNAFPECNFDCSFLNDFVEDDDGNRIYNRFEDGMRITMSGIISSFRRTTTKRTGALMCFMNLEDVYGAIECVCFPSVYEKVKQYLGNDKIVKLRGKLDIDSERGVSCIVDDLQEVELENERSQQPDSESKRSVLWLNAGALTDTLFEELIGVLTNYEGESVCKIVRNEKKYKLPQGVNYCRGLLAELYSLLEQSDIKFLE